MNKTNDLRKLLSNLSYYNAAEGEMYFREAVKRRDAERALKEFFSVHTRTEIEEIWPRKEDGTKETYLVYTAEFFPFCKEDR